MVQLVLSVNMKLTFFAAMTSGLLMGLMMPNSVAFSDLKPRMTILTNEEAWARLPATTEGTKPALPAWARMLAAEMPRTAAAYLQLDYAHRATSPLPAKLRAAMRWVAANANQCTYSKDQAIVDARAAGTSEAAISGLIDGSLKDWNDAECTALKFALDMTVDSDSVSDEQFADLVKEFGEKQTALHGPADGLCQFPGSPAAEPRSSLRRKTAP